MILTDLSSLESGQPKAFSIAVNGHNFSGAYTGVFALKAAADGRILKLACGGCTSLTRDGREILRLDHATDFLLGRNAAGAHEAVLLGEPASNSLKLLP